MTFSTFASPGVSLQGGGGSGGGGGGTPGGSNTQIQYNNSGAFAGASGLTTNGTELTIASGTKTADAPVLNMSQTWNNGAVTFTGLKFNATDTASASASLLMDLQVGGASIFSVRKDGEVVSALRFKSTFADISAYIVSPIWLANSNIGYLAFGTLSDTILTRRAAANLRLGAADTTGTTAPTPQFLSAQSWASSTTNNQTGANFTIDGSQGTGTGAGGSIIFRVAPAGGTSNGVQNALSTALTINSAGTATFSGVVVASSGVSVGANVLLTTNSGQLYFGAALDVILSRDAANTLALRNGTNAQLFRVYRTTDGTNASWLEMDANANGNAYIGTNKTGTGVAGPLYFLTGGTARWEVNSSGHFMAGADNLYDIGASLATRPRNIYVGTSVIAGNFLAAGSGVVVQTSSTTLRAATNGTLLLSNNANTDFGRLQFGGTSASFPALKRSSASLIVRLADDTANAALESASLKTDAPTGGTAATWKLGTVASVTPTLQNRTIEVDIGGTIYYISAKTTND